MFKNILLVLTFFVFNLLFSTAVEATDWCGPVSSVIGEAIPDSWEISNMHIGGITGSTTTNMESFETVYVGDACRNHDSCYASYKANKNDCDKAFLEDMESACNDSLSELSSAKRECTRRAKAYYNSVKKLGQHWFNKAQYRDTL